MNNTSFPPPFGSWYSRWASIYTDVPATVDPARPVTAIRALPRLTAAA